MEYFFPKKGFRYEAEWCFYPQPGPPYKFRGFKNQSNKTLKAKREKKNAESHPFTPSSIMEIKNRYGALVQRFCDLKEKYGDEYPIILYDSAIEAQEKRHLKDSIQKNHFLHIFSEFEDTFQFAKSLGRSCFKVFKI